MRNNYREKKQKFQRMIVSLPRPLVGQLRRYADRYRAGNKSGFVADAVKNHIEQLRKLHHTIKLREAYAAAAQHSLAIAKEWEPLDEEAWAQLVGAKAKKKKAQT